MMVWSRTTELVRGEWVDGSLRFVCAGEYGEADSPLYPFSQTTIMAVQFDGGVVLGADSRTTTG